MYAPAAPGQKIYDSFGLRTLPAPADASPRISRQQAVAIAHTAPQSGNRTGSPDAQLRLLTDANWPPGTTGGQRHFDHRLVWVITYTGSPPIRPGGPAPPPGPNPAQPAPSRPLPSPAVKYESVVMIDAATGRLLEDFSGTVDDS